MSSVYIVILVATLLVKPMSARSTREDESRRQLGLLAMLGEALVPLFAGAGEVAAGAALETGVGAAIDAGVGAAIDTGVGAAIDTGIGTAVDTGAGILTETGSGVIAGAGTLAKGFVDAELKAALAAGTITLTAQYMSHGVCEVIGNCRVRCIPILEMNQRLLSKIAPEVCPAGLKCCTLKPPKVKYTTTTASP